MTKDPVCGMQVDEKKTQHRTTYQGKEYAFCGAECKQSFDKNPQRYAFTRERETEQAGKR
jgi:YHS domain-containing protein